MDKVLADVLAWAWAVIDHWQVLVTGGVITATISLIQLRRKEPIQWKMMRRILALFLLIAFFQVWRDQHAAAETAERRAQKAEGELANRTPQVQVNIPAQPPPVVTVVPSAPAAHSRLAYTQPTLLPMSRPPFKPEQQFAVNLGFRNTGGYEAQNVALGAVLALIPGAEINEAFHKYERDIKFLQGGSLPPLSPGPASEGRYHTFTAPAFNLGDAEEINSGRKVMFVLGKVRWSDDTGSYELPFSMFFSAEPAPYTGFNWHTTKEDGHERKLR